MSVNSGQVFRWQELSDGLWLGVDGDRWYRASVHEEKALIDIESNGTPEDFIDLFRLDMDVDAVEADIVARGPEMAPYAGSLSGLRLMKSSCSTETFFCFLCSPNNNVARIRQMVRHLASYGPVLDTVQGIELRRFPNVEVIAAIPESELRSKAFGYRGGTIPSAARQVMDRGDRWIESLKSVPYERAHADLCSIKGIGPKLADCIALFALHHTEAVPIDTHIWQAMTRLYYPQWKGFAVTDHRYREASTHFRTRFGPLAGWAQQYLFYDNMSRKGRPADGGRWAQRPTPNA